MRRVGYGISLLIASMSIAGTPAFAQRAAAPRTSGGLFGATRSDAADRNRMNVLFELGTGYDSDVPPELRPSLPTDSRVGGGSVMFTGAADYAHARRHVQLAGTASTSFRYYERIHFADVVAHSAGIGADISLPNRSTVRLEQRAAYSPSYVYQLFPALADPTLGEALPAAPDYRVEQTDSYIYGSQATFAIGSIRGMQLKASGTYDRTEFRQHVPPRPNLEVSAGDLSVARSISHNARFSVEYEYRRGAFGFSGDSIEHRLTIGADYSRPLSGGRQVGAGVKVAPSTVEMPDSTVDTSLTGRVYRMQGEASASYKFRRTWHASGKVQRSIEYLAVLGEPVLASAGTFDLHGLLTRRIDLRSSAGYASGGSIFSGYNNFDTYRANLKFRFALKRVLALYGEYLYFNYDLRAGRPLLDLPSRFEQHGVRAGLTLWESVF